MSDQADILLIGGTGFIGSELARVFTEEGKEVVSIGRHPKPNHPGRVIVADLDHPITFAPELPRGSSVFILTGQNYKDFDERKELRALEYVITLLNGFSPKKVFYLSSALVYGETSLVVREDSICEPVENYSRFKCRAEAVLKKKLHPSILLGILRLGNVYGNPANRGFVHWLMQAVSHKQTLTLNGEGTQERDYVFIDDVVNALVQLEGKLQHSDTINIVSGKSTSLKEMVAIMEEIAGTAIPFEVNHQPLKEVQHSRIQPTKLEQEYGMILPHNLHAGLRITLKRYSFTS